jgi:phosphohistidine phosphatase SixA
VFVSKGKEALVEQSLAVSMADVMSSAVRARATAASVADMADNNCMADPWLTPDPQTAEAGDALTEDDVDWCLYVGTPWEEDVTADRRDIDEFKEASHMIKRTLAVMIHI